jgi:hypothetical protein
MLDALFIFGPGCNGSEQRICSTIQCATVPMAQARGLNLPKQELSRDILVASLLARTTHSIAAVPGSMGENS